MTWHRIDDPEHPAPKDGTLIVGAWWHPTRGAWAARDVRWTGVEWECPYDSHYLPPDVWKHLPEPPRP